MTRKEKQQKRTSLFSLTKYLLNKIVDKATKLESRRDKKNKVVDKTTKLESRRDKEQHEGHDHHGS